MILFPKNVLVYLKRQGLEIYSSGKSKLTFDFTPETVAAEEIKDKEKLRAQLTEFLESNKLTEAQKTIVLAEELIFQKALAEKAKLLEELPFPKEKIISKDYPAKNVTVAVNGEMFDLFDKTDYVVPITLLGMSTVDENNFKQILVNKNLLKQASLLEITDGGRTINLKLILILGLVVLLFGGGLFYFFRPKHRALVQQTAETKPATASAVIEISQKAKKDLVIKVINGTGIVGDAKKVQDALKALGYQNITTDNLEVQNATASAISFKDTVSGEFQKEITSALQKLFKSVVPQSASPSSTFDILVITGK